MYHGSEMSPHEEDFDWVTARGKCSIEIEFKSLADLAKRDVERKNKISKKDSNTEYFAYKPEGSKFRVVKIKSDRTSKSIIFSLDGDIVSVCKGEILEDEALFNITLTLNDEGECRYQIDGEGEFKTWQVLRKVLEPLFFGTNN